MKIKVFNLMSCIIVFVLMGTEPEPYASIKDLPFDSHGWFVNAEPLKKILMQCKPKIIVELGSWLGSSIIFMAQNTPDNVKLYAIDHWFGNVATQSNPQMEAKLKVLFQQFLSNVKHKKLTHKIIPIRMSTSEAAYALNIAPSMVYVDASHDEKSVFDDIVAWYERLQKGGIMCGDDWQAASVKKGVERASQLVKQTIHFEGNFWYFDPK